METVTAEFGKDLIKQSQFPGSSDSTLKIFDNASGAGAITSLLYSETYSNVHKEVLGGDISPAMIEQFKKRSEKNGWKGAKGEVIDAVVSEISH
jgi:ubiquinone/menaquinone biosynthesis C-methylase UbiE